MPSLSQNIQMIDIDKHPEYAKYISAVPSLQLSDGQVLIGSKAFDFIKQYDCEVELQTFSFAGSTGLPYSDVETDGNSWDFPRAYSEFSPLSE
jgi:hypothetical protein